MNREFLIILKRMNALIKRRATGSPKQFAQRLEIAESTLYKYIRLLKHELDAPIEYDPCRESYYYATRGDLVVGFQDLEVKEMIKLSGGYTQNAILLNNVRENYSLYAA